jgi:DedD protein
VKEGLKQRLVGGFVLAALAVIFLPGLFKEQQGHRVDGESRIPAAPPAQTVEFSDPDPTWEGEPAPQPETMFLPDEEDVSGSYSLPPQAQVATESTVVAASFSSASVVSSSSSSAASSSVAAVPVVPLDEKGIPQAWMLQLVSLSNREAAVKLRDDLQRDGYKAFIRDVKTDSGTFVRVFVGPNLNREESAKIKAELDRRLKTNAQIRRFEP